MQFLTIRNPMLSPFWSRDPPPHPASSPGYILGMTSYGVNNPLTSLGQLSWLCPLPASVKINSIPAKPRTTMLNIHLQALIDIGELTL